MPEMRVPLKWLKEFVDISTPLEELVERMTLAGLEVNAIERIGAEWDRDKIFVGEIIEVQPHPNADNLTIAVVDYGAGSPQAVVTGAPNIRVGESGQKVPFATRGARLIDGHAAERQYMILKPAKIRGVRSEGMVCSEKELGISEDHTGIMILPSDAPVGMPLQDYLGETVLVIEIVPNIARCLSIIGVAREIAALTKQKLHLKPPEWLAEGPPIEGQVEIEIADPDLCARYSAGLIRGVKIGPSPFWLRMRLIAAGMRPISNVVDITNYVMLEWGQPLHAFDYNMLRGRDGRRPPDSTPVIVVRRARPDEKMTTLDGVLRSLDRDMLLITDGGGPIAIAGVMGGLESEITENTTDILLESANFDYISNRRTSQLLNLPSEASIRFGRGIDPELTIPALKRAAEMMRVLAGGKIAAGIIDVYPKVPPIKVVDFPPSEVERLIGIKLSTDEIVEILESLEFRCEVSANGEGPLRVTVPTHRLDVSHTADLVEEIARIYGSENIPLTLINDPLPPQRNNEGLQTREKVRDILVGCGLSEIISYSLIGLEDQGKLLSAYGSPAPYQELQAAGEPYPTPCILPPSLCIRLANPLTPERCMMRTTLLPSLLMTVRSNLRYQAGVAIFELAKVYLPRKGQDLPDEPWHLGMAMTGDRFKQWWAYKKAEPMDFYDIKGVAETLMTRLGVKDVAYLPADSLIFQPGRAAYIVAEDTRVGIMGEIHPLVREAFDLPKQRVCLLELDLDQLMVHIDRESCYKPISRFPATIEDLALVVDKEVPARRLEEVILAAGGGSVVSVRLFDVYEGPPIPPGKKSLAYSIVYQDMDRTLTDKDVERIRQKIRTRLEREVGAQLRGE